MAMAAIEKMVWYGESSEMTAEAETFLSRSKYGRVGDRMRDGQ